MNCVLAEQRSDWVTVASAIASIEANVIKNQSKYKVKPHSPYLCSLFLSSMQRNLELRLPPDLLRETVDTVSL